MTAWISGCPTAPGPAARVADARALPDVLAAVAETPDAALELCAVLRTEAVRGDCVIQGVERMARTNPSGAEALCASLDGLSGDECWFQLAERSRDARRCLRAGRFAEDCRMHAWTALIPQLAGPTDDSQTWASAVTLAAADMDFAADDERPWIAASRFLLGRQFPLDRSFCDGWPSAEREICRRSGRGLFHDRVNHVRDARKWSCEGPPPLMLSVAEHDAELASVLAERRMEICP